MGVFELYECITDLPMYINGSSNNRICCVMRVFVKRCRKGLTSHDENGRRESIGEVILVDFS